MVKCHNDALVDELVNDKDNCSHVVNQTFALNGMLKHLVKTVVHCVEHGGQDELIVFLVAQDVNRHVNIAPEDGHIVFYSHDIVLELVQRLGVALLVRLEEERPFKGFLLGIRLESPRRVVVLGNDALALVIEDHDALDVAHHSFQHFESNLYYSE